MRRKVIDIQSRFNRSAARTLLDRFSNGIVGQADAVSAIVPFLQIYMAGLAPAGRPAGVFLLLGPTGTGKTRTVEALAEVLHGSAKNVLRIDCGEYQLDHEAAKLTGAPPGYLGHRETQPLLTQAKINAVASELSSLSLVLFDEIEKASPSVMRLLLGVLDKATLRLGDNNQVNFERTMIFMTSNLGAHQIREELRGRMGFRPGVAAHSIEERVPELDRIAKGAARRHFSPEFINRLDSIVTYYPLDEPALAAILDQQLAQMQQLITQRLANEAFELVVSDKARKFLIKQGTSQEYGARELKRVLHRQLMQPMAALVADRRIPDDEILRVDLSRDGKHLTFS